MSKIIKNSTIAALCGFIVLAVVVISQAIIIVELERYNRDIEGFADYWREKIDSLHNRNFELTNQLYVLQDSLFYIKYGR